MVSAIAVIVTPRADPAAVLFRSRIMTPSRNPLRARVNPV
jgi:hypothetical protein